MLHIKISSAVCLSISRIYLAARSTLGGNIAVPAPGKRGEKDSNSAADKQKKKMNASRGFARKKKSLKKRNQLPIYGSGVFRRE
jgi:hypothetical protein